ncbi:hypothetical protein CAPTEDRAFT_214536 [Capitella teleta]|uniref:Uncharacterized protein n=1 Tax=Capitella teleta TaxID=283909 RepID=R7UKS2_CAPTE|nr:hypothetical protein CAPTEDRAFT_214536 [Capitella teleta]|eukprot:ELU06835.1 hypothetical protein CAPTEDRAFT_214536 [Capitella teleta]
MKANLAEYSTLTQGGLKFIPSRSQVDKFTLNNDLERFYRRVKLHNHFNNPNKTISTLDEADTTFKKFQPPSTWCPLDDPQSEVSLFIEKCKQDIADLSSLQPLRSHNISREERKTLNTMRNRKDIVIKPADKGGAVVVWRKDLYIVEVEEQLNNTNFYERETHNKTQENNKIVENTIISEINKRNLPEDAKFLSCKNYTQLLRLRKLTTKDDDYEDCSTQMISFFTNQGCPTNLLTQAKLKVNQHTQQTLLQNSKNATTAPYQIPFVTTYHPEINKIHNILNKNWTIFSSTKLRTTKNKKLNKLTPHQKRSHNTKDHLSVVTIQEDLTLSSSEHTILSRGLEFIPSRSQVDKFTLNNDLERFYRRVKLHSHFNNPNKTISTLDEADTTFKKFQPPSTWCPPDDPQSEVSLFIEKCKQDIGDLSSLQPLRSQPKKEKHSTPLEIEKTL